MGFSNMRYSQVELGGQMIVWFNALVLLISRRDIILVAEDSKKHNLPLWG